MRRATEQSEGKSRLTRRAQGLPVNMIVLTALALLVLVVVGAFFISGFGEASGSVNVVDADQADCQSVCQSLAASAFNYNDCALVAGAPQAVDYAETVIDGDDGTCASLFGACTVTISGGNQCSIQ